MDESARGDWLIGAAASPWDDSGLSKTRWGGPGGTFCSRIHAATPLICALESLMCEMLGWHVGSRLESPWHGSWSVVAVCWSNAVTGCLAGSGVIYPDWTGAPP
ncbi:hypothetical protein LX36DRAFT_311256 [Colletotrichum falcatum]|nr:hypothetical protein LX36DRAFT_311256 [Colletotrichum falcatum]